MAVASPSRQAEECLLSATLLIVLTQADPPSSATLLVTAHVSSKTPDTAKVLLLPLGAEYRSFDRSVTALSRFAMLHLAIATSFPADSKVRCMPAEHCCMTTQQLLEAVLARAAKDGVDAQVVVVVPEDEPACIVASATFKAPAIPRVHITQSASSSDGSSLTGAEQRSTSDDDRIIYRMPSRTSITFDLLRRRLGRAADIAANVYHALSSPRSSRSHSAVDPSDGSGVDRSSSLSAVSSSSTSSLSASPGHAPRDLPLLTTHTSSASLSSREALLSPRESVSRIRKQVPAMAATQVMVDALQGLVPAEVVGAIVRYRWYVRAHLSAEADSASDSVDTTAAAASGRTPVTSPEDYASAWLTEDLVSRFWIEACDPAAGCAPEGVGFPNPEDLPVMEPASPSAELVSPQSRIAVFGGSFNPATTAHLVLASEALRCCGVDAVWIVPCGPRPDKPSMALHPAERLVACFIAVEASFPYSVPVVVAPIEVHAKVALSSYELMHQLQDKYGRVHSFEFMIGADLLPTLASWRYADKLLESTPFLCVPRRGYEREWSDFVAAHEEVERTGTAGTVRVPRHIRFVSSFAGTPVASVLLSSTMARVTFDESGHVPRSSPDYLGVAPRSGRADAAHVIVPFTVVSHILRYGEFRTAV